MTAANGRRFCGNEQGCRALLLASAAGYGEIVKALPEAAADRSLRHKRRTRRRHANASGQTAVVELLK